MIFAGKNQLFSSENKRIERQRFFFLTFECNQNRYFSTRDSYLVGVYFISLPISGSLVLFGQCRHLHNSFFVLWISNTPSLSLNWFFLHKFLSLFVDNEFYFILSMQLNCLFFDIIFNFNFLNSSLLLFGVAVCNTIYRLPSNREREKYEPWNTAWVCVCRCWHVRVNLYKIRLDSLTLRNVANGAVEKC